MNNDRLSSLALMHIANFLTRCKMVRSEVFSWVNLIHKKHIDFMILLDRIYLELPKICSSCLSRHELSNAINPVISHVGVNDGIVTMRMEHIHGCM
jgi:hypothetical protein